MTLLAESVRSLPSRERGLKQSQCEWDRIIEDVVPFTGAWIETLNSLSAPLWVLVAPFTGAWIEIFFQWADFA